MLSLRLRPGRFLIAALTVLLFSQTASAQVTYLNNPSITGITGTADRMISYRHQQHSWQTPDGAFHVMVNRGNVPTGDALVLFSTFDGGTTWTQELTLPGTDAFSTSDGMLATVNGVTNLLVVYATAQATGTIMFVSIAYNPTTQTWTPAAAQTAYAQPNFAGSTPALGSDSTGTFWCVFTAQDLTTLQYQEQLVYRPAKSRTWTNTGLVFGGIDDTLQHSGRPVAYTGGVGMIFEDGPTLYWAYRLNSWTPSTPWVTQVIYTGLPPYNMDPYGSHYSVVNDNSNNLHLGLIANQQLVYMRYISGTGLWGTPRPLTSSSIQAAYTQATIVGSTLMLYVNYLQSLEVLQSVDHGNTFTLTTVLTHPTPPPGSSLYYGNPRMETPSRAQSPVPTLQQYVDGTTQNLLFFAVPSL